MSLAKYKEESDSGSVMMSKIHIEYFDDTKKSVNPNLLMQVKGLIIAAIEDEKLIVWDIKDS
jgi:hypothetical protein